MTDPSFDPRVAGQILRYHTWPHLREQSVGEHTWQIMRILTTVWPEVPRKLLMHVLFHDVGEMAGDIPWPWKTAIAELHTGMRRAEQIVYTEMQSTWEIPPPITLSKYEFDVYKTCEYIEMWEWALNEKALGNTYAGTVATRMIQAASGNMALLKSPPSGYTDIRPAITRYVQKRTEHHNGEIRK